MIGHSSRPMHSVYVLAFLLACALPLCPSVHALQPETLEDIEQKLQQTPDSIDLLSTKGTMQRRAHDYEGAVATYERILALAPEDIGTRNLLALVLHKAAGDMDAVAALPLLRRAVELAPDAEILRPAYLDALYKNEATHELATAYESLPAGYEMAPAMLAAVANAYREAGKLTEAVALYRSVLSTTPADADAGLGLALTLLDAENYPEALEAIQTTLTLYPQRPNLLLALAAIQWKSGTRVLALDTFDRILDIDPHHADAVNLKAQLLCDMGCISLAQETVSAHPSLVWPHVRNYVEKCTADARANWDEETAPNALSRLEPDQLLAFCYYDITDDESAASTVVTSLRFLQHIEYLRTHGYHFVSAGDVVAARRHERDLPENAVLLTFDHGYAGIIKRVIPILELYNIPAIVSVCPVWIESGPPVDLNSPLMTWSDVGLLAGHRLISLGLEAEGLFELVRANPQGDTGFAAMTCIYDPHTGRYETEAEQRDRITTTLGSALRLMDRRIGSRPRVLVWSHGARSTPASAEAERLGFVLQLGLQSNARITDTERMERIPVLNNAPIGAFISLARPMAAAMAPLRAVCVPMDAIDAPSEHELDINLALLTTRLQALGANTVILGACADADADGNTEAVYFPTTQVRVKHDVLDHVVAHLQRDRFRVFLEMPVLTIERPATARNDSMRVMDVRTAGVRPSFALQKRYSPFEPNVTDWVTQLYRDLAAHVRCDGIVFGDDLYLTDNEDYNPAAQKVYAARLGTPTPGTTTLEPDQEQAWVRIKTETLNRLTSELGEAVRHYRPSCQMVRSLFAPALHYPESERWLAQNYVDAAALYDYILLMAYVEMEDVGRPDSWLAKLVELAAAQDNGLEKTVFKLQAVNWEKHKPIRSGVLRDRLRHLARSGALHLAYGPDAPGKDEPASAGLKRALSEETRPRK